MFPIRDHNPSHKFPFVTLLLIGLNTLFFLIEISLTDIDAFIYKYALVPRLIDFSDISTLSPFLSSMFLHGGWLHIISNMWFLWVFGDNIEATLGKINYLLFYAISGFAASLLQYFTDPNSTTAVLGASGGIAGVLGGYLVIFPHAKIETLVTIGGLHFSTINIPASFMLFYWFITQFFAGVGSVVVGAHAQGGVAFFAHIGGFVAGWIMAQGIRSRLNWYRIE